MGAGGLPPLNSISILSRQEIEMSKYGRIVFTAERWWFLYPLKFLHLLRYPWAQWLAYYKVSRNITAMDAATGTITVDRPFPSAIKSGTKIAHALDDND